MNPHLQRVSVTPPDGEPLEMWVAFAHLVKFPIPNPTRFGNNTHDFLVPCDPSNPDKADVWLLAIAGPYSISAMDPNGRYWVCVPDLGTRSIEPAYVACCVNTPFGRFLIHPFDKSGADIYRFMVEKAIGKFLESYK